MDAVGVFLLYNEENQKDVSFIRKHLVGRVSGRCILEANNSKEAIKNSTLNMRVPELAESEEKRKQCG